MPVYNREYKNPAAVRFMLYDYDTGTFEKRRNLEVSQREKGTVSVSITISQMYFGIELTPDQADDFIAGLTEITQLVREQKNS